MAADIKQILQNNEFLTNQNANYRSYCEELARYCLPRKSWIDSMRTHGERVKFNFLYDSTAIRAVRICAAGFFSRLTNPSARWFGFELRNKELGESKTVKEYFYNREDQIYDALNNSNFYETIQECLLDYVTFGNAPILTLEDPAEEVRYTSIPIQSANIVEDARGHLNGFYYNFQKTASQAYGMWGNNAGKTVIEAHEKKPFEMLDFVHYVGPRHRRDSAQMDSSNMAFESVWINKKDKHLISESGFMEMPYSVGRFYKDSVDVMGFSPAMDVLPEIKLVNAMQKTVIRAGMKQADPPLVMPSKGFVLPLNLNPAAMNYRDAKTPNDSLQALPVISGNLSIGVEMIKMVQENIEKGFFVRLFQSLNDINKQMTVPEVQQRVSEDLMLAAPVVNRFTKTLSNIIIRTFNIMERNMKFPDPPEEIQGQEFGLIFLSPLAQAMRETDIQKISGYLNDVGMIAQFKPAVLDKVNEDRTADILAKVRGVNPDMLNSEEEVAAIRQGRQEQEQAMAAAQMGQAAGKMEKDFAQASAVGAPKGTKK